MSNNDVKEICQQTETVLVKSAFSIQAVLNMAADPKFKMLLVDSLETIKERRDNILKKQELPSIPLALSTANADVNTNLFHSDKEIASQLFNNCNAAVKDIYTYLNHYKGIDKKVEKEIKDAVKAIERLREHLAEYL